MGVPTDTMWLTLLGNDVSQRFYDAGGIRTRALVAGDGPPLLLLHGTGGHAETYQRNIVPLSERFTVYAVDMVGHGFTDRPDAPYSLDTYADHVVAFLDAIGAERASIQGESLGGMVAAWTAITYPDRVERIVCNTGLLARTDAKGMKALEDLQARTHALASDLTLENIQRRLAWLVKDPERMTGEMAAIRHAIYSQPGMMDDVVRIMDAIIATNRGVYDGTDYFAPGIMDRIACPVLFLWTTHNPGKGVDLVESVMGSMKDARLAVVDDAGHWPQFEKPDEVNRVLLDFLS